MVHLRLTDFLHEEGSVPVVCRSQCSGFGLDVIISVSTRSVKGAFCNWMLNVQLFRYFSTKNLFSCFTLFFFFLLFSTQQEETSSKFSTLKAVCVPEPFSSLCLWMRYSLHIWLICHFHHWQLAVFGWRLINYFFPLSKVKTLEMQKKVVLCHFWTGKAL